MADERSKPPYVPASQSSAHTGSQSSFVPKKYNWQSLLKKDGDELFDHYRHLLEELGQRKGLLQLIFGRAQNKFQDPAKLRRLIVDLIDKEDWSSMSADVKGDAYEGLLEKKCTGYKIWSRTVFYPSPINFGYGRRYSAKTQRYDLRSCMWYRRLSTCLTRLHRKTFQIE
jgi:type I restriction enzyme M protein